MCGGMLGEAIGGIDKAANAINPMKQPMQWLTDNTVTKVFKPAGKLYDYSNSHPLESLAAMASIYAGGAGMGAWGDAGAGAGEAGAAGAADAGALDTGSVNLFADAVPGAGGDVGATAAGMSGAGADTAGIGTMAGSGGGGGSVGNFLSSVFGGGGAGGGSGFGMNMGTAKNALGAMQVLSSLYGMDQSRKLSKKATSQSISNAGLQAVQRSMAAQGYQGSGNMMAALSRYGADAYTADLGQQQTSLNNTMSGLGLLTAGMGNLAGWGSTGGTKP